jgi:hypothetical protein
LSNNKQRAVGIIVTHRKTKAVQYVIKNNSTERSVEKFYIDHTADASHNGFVIKTTDKCIKSVTGWSRYEFSLKPQEETTFTVVEEAIYDNVIKGTSNLIVSFFDYLQSTCW